MFVAQPMVAAISIETVVNFKCSFQLLYDFKYICLASSFDLLLPLSKKYIRTDFSVDSWSKSFDRG